MLLAVVGEPERAGVVFAGYVREEANNTTALIILRTVKPGQVAEPRPITGYDINGQNEKTGFTSSKVSTRMKTSLRSHRDIASREKCKRGLEAVIEASATVFELKSMENLTPKVLKRMRSLLQTDKGPVNFGVNTPAASG